MKKNMILVKKKRQLLDLYDVILLYVTSKTDYYNVTTYRACPRCHIEVSTTQGSREVLIPVALQDSEGNAVKLRQVLLVCQLVAK